MIRRVIKTGLSTLMAGAAMAGTAYAGGLERGGYNIDLLFDTSRFATEAAITYVMPDRQLNNVVDTNPLNGVGANGIGGGATNGVKNTESYAVPRLGAKIGLTENIDCMADYSQPFGAHENPGRNWMGANSNIETRVNSDGVAATCSFKMQVGKGTFRVLGGVSHLEMDGFKTRLVAPIPAVFSGVGRVDLKDNGMGWRFGGAYEIPEIAFRASAVYYSAVKLDSITGTLDLTGLPLGFGGSPVAGRIVPIFGSATMPQSFELKVQSGIAPGWLAFGSIKWVDWSVLQTIPLCISGVVPAAACNSTTQATSLDLVYQDGWTVTGGIGHKFTDSFSGVVAVTWDRGTSTGVGTQTDTWSVAAGGAFIPNESVEFRFGGALGMLTSGASGRVGPFGTEASYTFGSDLVAALSASAKVKF